MERRHRRRLKPATSTAAVAIDEEGEEENRDNGKLARKALATISYERRLRRHMDIV